jgi:large subunit ribosomal protein L11
MEIFKPPVSFLLKQAAGIKRASMEPGKKVSGIVSIKHVYEIANFKLKDINCAHLSLKEMCIKVINTANRAGIKVVKEDINPGELKEFLDKRRLIEEAEKAELVEKKAAKAMRASAAAAAASASAAPK